ncbi:MAG: glycosyltransferase family 2 protein [Streptosporangiaceae bacterium]
MTRQQVTASGAGSAGLDPADEAALWDFHQAYKHPRLAPVAIVMAAYNEAESIAGVLGELPHTLCGLATDIVVVVDGATDDTAGIARAHGAYACVAPVNRGQGAALRLGYRVAREAGARYIVTTDADGQYDPGDMATVLEPVVRGDADFATGSRRLGRQETTDPVRHVGVRVFAWLVSGLTGHRVTDTSFGLRAMKAHVTEAVTLTQPQYQASELLIGVIAKGFRVVERPATMRQRNAGVSKKGHNMLYGLHYARVVLGTWQRERALAEGASRSRPVVTADR